MTATSPWFAACADLTPLAGPAGIAERLVLLLHYGIDWDNSWVGSHRATYWDRLLPERIAAATYGAASLRRWWGALSDELESSPRNEAERLETSQLLQADPYPVMTVLRHESAALTLRVRIIAEAVRENRTLRKAS